MIISAIEPQRRNRKRRSVYIDGQFAFGLDVETLVKLSLKVGKEVDRAELERIVFEEDKHKAKESILRLLSFRERSRKELTDRLTQKGFTPPVIEKSVEELAGVGLVDDQRFARNWIRARALGSHKGKRLIRFELLRKGLSRGEIDHALKTEEIDERVLANEVVAKYASRYKALKPNERKRKLFELLMRRGFSPEVAHDALEIPDEPEHEDEA